MRDNGQIRKLAAYVLSDYILLQFHGKKVRDLNEVKKELFYYEKKILLTFIISIAIILIM